MKRKTTVILFLIISSFAAYAQNDSIQTLPWCEDFDNGTAPGWQFIDNDGDGMNWSVSDYEPYNGAFSLFGPSYSNHTEDNWAISPAIEIPQNDQDIILTWKVYSHNNYSESYEVRIATVGNDDLDDYDSLFAETLSGGYYERQLNLSAYAGSTVHVAFRHRSTFQNYLCIDAVCITSTDHQLQPPSVEIEAPDSALVNSDVTLTALSYNADRYEWLIEGASVATATSQQVITSWTQKGRYDIKVTAFNEDGSTTASKTITIVEKLSIPQMSASDITIFPNPTSGLLAIKANGLENIDILNQTGAVVAAGAKETLDLSSLPSGIYFIRITTQSGATVQKIIKK